MTSVLAPGTFAAPQTAAAGLLQAEQPLQRSHHVLDARYSFNRNKQETQGVGGLNTFDRRSNTEGRTDAFITSLRQQLRLEQGERGALPLHLRRRRLLFAADGAERRGVADAGLQHRAGHGHLHRRRQPRDQSGIPAEPGREARRSGWITSRWCKASHQFKTGVDIIGSWRFVTFFNNFPGTYTFAQGTRYAVQRQRPGDLPVPVHAELRRLRPELHRTRWPASSRRTTGKCAAG